MTTFGQMQPNFVENEPYLAKKIAKYFKIVENFVKNPRNFIYTNATQSYAWLWKNTKILCVLRKLIFTHYSLINQWVKQILLII